MRVENFQVWAVVVLPTFGDVLNYNQKNGIKNKGYYSNVSALNSHQSLLCFLFISKNNCNYMDHLV